MEEGEEEVLDFLDKVLEDEDGFEYEADAYPESPGTLGSFKVGGEREGRENE